MSTDAPDDEAKKAQIACALWTELHWAMPTDCAISITIDGNDIAVILGPPRTGDGGAVH